MNMDLLMRATLSLKADGTYQAFSPEAWQYAGEMTLLGMGMVFAVLAILWGILAIFKLIFAGKTPKAPKAPKVKVEKAKEPSAPVTDAAPSAAVTAPTPSSAVSETQSNDALIAILTAAVTAYREEEGATGSFRVVSFKRTGGAWNTKR